MEHNISLGRINLYCELEQILHKQNITLLIHYDQVYSALISFNLSLC